MVINESNIMAKSNPSAGCGQRAAKSDEYGVGEPSGEKRRSERKIS
jgi:hypothetical protein